MQARIWGARGSLASPGPDTVRYGGNTSCVEVELGDGTLVVLDAGTGIRELGERLVAASVKALHICLTHLHLDHLEGLPFFAPLWDGETEIDIWGPPSPITSLPERIGRYLSPPLFPRYLSDIRAKLRFHDVPEGAWQLGSARVVTAALAHPGPTVGYRLEEDGFALAYMPDHEPALVGDLADGATDWLSGFDVAERATVLLHDAQYFADEYEARIGWGHSSVEDSVRFARAAGAERLVLFHHDPSHSDADLALLEQRAALLWDGGEPPVLAHEGMELLARQRADDLPSR